MIMESIITAFATGFGLGYSPWLPGTIGALPGLLLAWVILRQSRRRQVLSVLFLIVLAVPVCHITSNTLGGKDDSRIVADEFLLFPAAVALQSAARHPAVLLGTFAVSRVMDGLKPPPAAQAEGFAGGLGIVLDDLIANIYLWLLLAAGIAGQRRISKHR